VIRAVVFDVVGTLLHAEPGVAEAYHRIGKRHGSELTEQEIRSRFRQVMTERPLSPRTSEAEELLFWRETVAGVLGNVDDPEQCFQDLYQYFATPAAWRIDPLAESLLAALRARDCSTALASNFDVRLHSVIAGTPGLQGFDHVLISSQVGWRKPASEFFEAVIHALQLPASSILMVGDDLQNDILPARRLGIQALHLSPGNQSETDPGECTINSLTDVLKWCRVHGRNE